MLKSFVSKKHLLLYFTSIAITWLEAIIYPSLVSMIVASIEAQQLNQLWQALFIGILGNFILLIGLAGKRYYYAHLVADFNKQLKERIFQHFLTSDTIKSEDLLSNLENDVKQLENNYLESAVIILSSLGFTTISIIYALSVNFWLGLVFILFYSIPALSSGIGAKKLDKLSLEKTTVNQSYLAALNSFISGSRVIKTYQAEGFFFQRFQTDLDKTIQQGIRFEKQRTLNSTIIKVIDSFCSIFPLVIGGLMTYKGYLSGSSLIAIYLVSYTIGYQFNELSYFINTYKSTQQLRDKYQFALKPNPFQLDSHQPRQLFPIELKNLTLTLGGRLILDDFSLRIKQGEKIAIIGESGSGKSSLLNLLAGEIQADAGEILFNGQELPMEARRSQTAYILQDSHVFTSLSLMDNIALGQASDLGKLKQVVTAVNLDRLSDDAAKLSGGERQRLDIARCLYHHNSLILADEIKSNLDKKNAKQIENLLFSLPQTVIEVIHHYDEESLARYDQVIRLG